MSIAALLFALLKPRRFIARAGVTLLLLNEVRGIITVIATAPAWFPLIVGVFHAAMGR
jgi:hypothetical protein